MSNDKQRSLSLQFLNRAHIWIRLWLLREAVTRNSEYLALYWSSSTIITSNYKRRYIAWVEMTLDWFEWIYEMPFGAHVNNANWCPILLSSWREETVDDPWKVSNRIFLLMSATKFSMHGSPRYWNTLVTALCYVIIQVNLLLYSCHLFAYNQTVLYIPRQDSNPGFRETSVTGDITISYAIYKR